MNSDGQITKNTAFPINGAQSISQPDGDESARGSVDVEEAMGEVSTGIELGADLASQNSHSSDRGKI